MLLSAEDEYTDNTAIATQWAAQEGQESSPSFTGVDPDEDNLVEFNRKAEARDARRRVAETTILGGAVAHTDDATADGRMRRANACGCIIYCRLRFIWELPVDFRGVTTTHVASSATLAAATRRFRCRRSVFSRRRHGSVSTFLFASPS
ncbi:hypothetical protein PIB30_059318 [Stylosanthes scabra]|uniref:Uncharacterized protein n=1 Tax=Stylosanthes scabra TaxID=79078 RepID=A0ABU6ZIX2_9FABA|nr:hypothetical protein [Stylosanthes scabra]